MSDLHPRQTATRVPVPHIFSNTSRLNPPGLYIATPPRHRHPEIRKGICKLQPASVHSRFSRTSAQNRHNHPGGRPEQDRQVVLVVRIDKARRQHSQ